MKSLFQLCFNISLEKGYWLIKRRGTETLAIQFSNMKVTGDLDRNSHSWLRGTNAWLASRDKGRRGIEARKRSFALKGSPEWSGTIEGYEDCFWFLMGEIILNLYPNGNDRLGWEALRVSEEKARLQVQCPEWEGWDVAWRSGAGLTEEQEQITCSVGWGGEDADVGQMPVTG